MELEFGKSLLGDHWRKTLKKRDRLTERERTKNDNITSQEIRLIDKQDEADIMNDEAK